MSRIGNKPIPVPSGVQVDIKGSDVTVKGGHGELTSTFHRDMKIIQEDSIVRVERPSDEGEHRALHGLTRSLLANMIIGVNEGFQRDLELVGVGYRVQQSGQGITLSVMYSHTVDIQPPEGVTLQVEGNNRITVKGIDKQKVGQLAAQIRKVRPPNIYTGKGIRYLGEQIRLKPGKSARRA
ncbi:MAG: 50S ribosomal protein L6 [Chloroflexi bacterium]|nr:50S ribosomal protein L6 [Chloroflexota bacterium]MCH8868820.1 50S ribosomal protein L6 [Chloroflexota bacterium]MCH9038117.1 50S ribosomal protein L6 [Chloroflexota bacterium]MCI0770367.1 50S ribosomal protein L6 [Chloroflexota bacterium]MCI0790240.1 50S ribosomal protein L6 [Chloroflexota bacterium]